MRIWFLAFALLLGACASGPEPSFSPAESAQALVRWRRAENPLVCEAIVSRASDGAVRAQLYKGSPRVLLTLDLSAAGRFRASGPLAGIGWQGSVDSAPLPLSTWAKFLEIYQTAAQWPNGEREIHTAEARAAVNIVNKRIVSLSVINAIDNETLTATFDRLDPVR